MLKLFYLILAVLITSSAHAETRTILVNPNQSKTLIKPHVSGVNCKTGNVRVSIIKTPKLGKISIADTKVKVGGTKCNGVKVKYRSNEKGKTSVTIKIIYPNGKSTTTKLKIKVK